MADDATEFYEIVEDGGQVRVDLTSTVKRSAIIACPFMIMDASHYGEDGSCRCGDAKERARMAEEWGYTAEDFKRVGIDL